jgi:formamidopyrimidine-DNA glycosylase
VPELPDVELYKRRLDQHALHQKIARVVVSDARILGELKERAFGARLKGNRLEGTRRHGKHLLVQLANDGWLTLHFGMTGDLRYVEPPDAEVPYDRVRLVFERGSLAYVNRRMLGRVGLTEDADAFIAAEQLGPDALDPAFDLGALSAALDGRRDVKTVLMDQAVVAGIGNLYADEILFQARLHPKTPGRGLDKGRRRALLGEIKARSSFWKSSRKTICCRSATKAGSVRIVARRWRRSRRPAEPATTARAARRSRRDGQLRNELLPGQAGPVPGARWRFCSCRRA